MADSSKREIINKIRENNKKIVYLGFSSFDKKELKEFILSQDDKFITDLMKRMVNYMINDMSKKYFHA